MKLLVLGSGGREHAITWKLSQSSKLDKIFVAPGNPGTAKIAVNITLDPGDFNAVRAAVLNNSIDMVLVGPEAPLVDGIRDFFESDPQLKHVSVIGPGKKGAMLEGSKDFAKAFMMRNKIPTARYRSFTSESIGDAAAFLETLNPPYVLKADGLAAGKGVLIINDYHEAVSELKGILAGRFGSAGDKVVIEEYLKGIELSVFIITDGTNYKILPEAKDYKRIGEQDTGKNTGGMGAVSPVPFATAGFMKKVEERIIKPTVNGLIKEGIDYRGFIFFGLMNVDGDPYVIEYNARLGDPESEVVMPRIESDFADLLEGVAKRNLNEKTLAVSNKTAVTVMLVSGGYPDDFKKGYTITGTERVKDSILFHAGTRMADGNLVNSGGRVIAVTSMGKGMNEALELSYKSACEVSFKDVYYRKDIGFDLSQYIKC